MLMPLNSHSPPTFTVIDLRKPLLTDIANIIPMCRLYGNHAHLMFIGVHQNCNLGLGTKEDHAIFCNGSTNIH